jgi:cob(I)alamin adenosyltransferase
MFSSSRFRVTQPRRVADGLSTRAFWQNPTAGGTRLGDTMGNRLSKIYTRTGDDGTTGLGDGTRVPKDGARVEAYGTVDELNSAIGVLLATPGLPDGVTACLLEIQHELFDMGGELCIPGHQVITAEHILRLERTLDGFNDALPPLKEFILPGGGPAAAACHLARTVARRAERRVWTLAKAEPVSTEVSKYLNRLSDLLFVLARVLARHERGVEVLWRHDRGKPG